MWILLRAQRWHNTMAKAIISSFSRSHPVTQAHKHSFNACEKLFDTEVKSGHLIWIFFVSVKKFSKSALSVIIAAINDARRLRVCVSFCHCLCTDHWSGKHFASVPCRFSDELTFCVQLSPKAMSTFTSTERWGESTAKNVLHLSIYRLSRCERVFWNILEIYEFVHNWSIMFWQQTILIIL